jgi:hypothetical protein
MAKERRLVGIDLGIASEHTVRVLRGDGSEVCRRRARPTVESLAAVEAAALTGAAAGTRLEVVMEPTGPAWLPVAVFFLNRGHRVFRVAQRQGRRSAPFSLPACQKQWHRRRHPGPAAPARAGEPAPAGTAPCRGGRAGPAGAGL